MKQAKPAVKKLAENLDFIKEKLGTESLICWFGRLRSGASGPPLSFLTAL